MASVFVTTTAAQTRWSPYALANYERVLRAAEHDRFRVHRRVSDPDSADVILFVESRCAYHFDVLASPIYRRLRDRCFIFDGNDNPIPRIPGIYMGIPKTLQTCPAYQYGFYLRVFDNGVLREASPHDACRYLFSFVGNAANAPGIRRAVLALAGDRAYLRDSSSGQSDGDIGYAQVIEQSKFVLCPRGIGPSTWRLFETMRAGRVPVIISDHWRPPRGPAWDEFSLVVPESEIERIPERLTGIEPLAEQMGRRAYDEWDRHFSLGAAFNWIGDTLDSIQRARQACRGVIERSPLREALGNPLHRRKFLREFARETISSLVGSRGRSASR